MSYQTPPCDIARIVLGDLGDRAAAIAYCERIARAAKGNLVFPDDEARYAEAAEILKRNDVKLTKGER